MTKLRMIQRNYKNKIGQVSKVPPKFEIKKLRIIVICFIFVFNLVIFFLFKPEQRECLETNPVVQG